MRFALPVVLAAMLLVPATALALVDVGIGFDPAEVCPGEEVYFFFSLENIGAEETEVTLSFSFELNGDMFGPFTTPAFPLAAGEEISREAMLMIPMGLPPSSLAIYVEATDADGTASDDAALTILDCTERGAKLKEAKSDKAEKELAKDVRKMLKKLVK
jgi:hypothetical protein